MRTKVFLAVCAMVGGVALPLEGAWAKVAAEKAAELDGPKLTCMGAERAGSASGIPDDGSVLPDAVNLNNLDDWNEFHAATLK